jgi:hypothetical protein
MFLDGTLNRGALAGVYLGYENTTSERLINFASSGVSVVQSCRGAGMSCVFRDKPMVERSPDL